ncbi:class I SAM-dependent methyltransferase [Candidatus Omnitrophota bacterium]
MSSPNRLKSLPAGGNIYNKYETKNPLYKYAVNRFLKTLLSLTADLKDAKTLLEVGCGDGYLLNHTSGASRFSRIEGIDVSEEIVQKAKILYPRFKFSAGSACKLAYSADEFDLVLACEVLEHLDSPAKALSEIKRVAGKYCIISVPLEPLWRIANLARGAYVSKLGNTPGHVQHWGKKTFLALLEKHFTVEKIHYPLPWQMALCKK